MARAQANISFLPQTQAPQTQPQQVTIYQREFQQDVIAVNLKLATDASSKYQSGMPVALWWGWSLQEADWFYGYVNHTEPVTSTTTWRTMNVYCAGAVWPMRLVSQRSWSSATSDSVVTEVAGNHRLSCLVTPDPYALPHLTQHGKSDWAFLAQLARRRGYTFYARNTDLRYIPRMITPSARIPLFTKYPPAVAVSRGAITAFTRVQGQTVPGQGVKASRVQHVIMSDGSTQTVRVDPPQTNLSGSTLTDPLFSAVEMGHPASTTADAMANLNGVAQSNRFHIGATACLTGDVRVHQGMTIRIAGVSEQDDGYWWVTEATHTITLVDYTTDVVLARDSMGAPIASPDTTTVRSSILGRPLIADSTSKALTWATAAPPTIYDSAVSAVSVVPVADPVTQVANQAPRPVQHPIVVPVTTSGTTKYTASRLHVWRASVSSVRLTS